MSNSLISLKSMALSLVLGGLVFVGTADAKAFGDDGHGDHSDGGKQEATTSGFAGDAYLLDTDAVTGKKLGPIGKQVIISHEGREFRFSGKKSAAKFEKKPSKYIASVDEKMIAQQLAYYPLTTCVVSGDKLGGEMGDIIDVVHQNRLVRLCCNGCKKALAKDPESIFAKIDAAVIETQSKTYSQTTCVVTGEKLGGMGDTIDHVVGNRLIRLCCKGCVKKVKADPLKYLAMVDKGAGKKKAGKGHGGGDGHGDHDH